MREKQAGGARFADEVDQALSLVYLPDHVDAADLWDVEFKVIPQIGIEIRIDPTVFKRVDSVFVVGVKLYEAIDRILFVVVQPAIVHLFVFNGDPLVESVNKSCFCNLHSRLAATTAAKQIVAGT